MLKHSNRCRGCARDFYFEGMPVGKFNGPVMPRSPGQFHFEPYRGPGHYGLATQLRAGGKPQCYYDEGDVRVKFAINACPSYGVLDLCDFEIVPRDANELRFENWWNEYQDSGTIEPVRLGMLRDDLLSLFGEPDSNSAEKAIRPPLGIWEYGAVEFHFDTARRLFLIYTEDEGGNARVIAKDSASKGHKLA